MFCKFYKYVEIFYKYKLFPLVITGQIIFWYEKSKLHFGFQNKASLSQQKISFLFAAVAAKLEEMQWTFHIMYKPYLAIQMVWYLAQEPLCSAH